MQELRLVLRGAPTAVDVKLDSIAGGIGRRSAQRAEQSGVEVGHARRLAEDGLARLHSGAGVAVHAGDS